MVFLDDSFFKNLLRRGLDGSFLFFEKVGEMVDKFVFFEVQLEIELLEDVL